MPSPLTFQTLTWSNIADILDALPDVLLDRRTDLGLSLRQVGQAVDLPVHVIARAEHGEPIFAHHLSPIMRWLDDVQAPLGSEP